MKYEEKLKEKIRQDLLSRWDEIQESRERFGAKQRELEEDVENTFNRNVNCGGYALEIDACVFPTYKENFEQTISCILNAFQFVRLLGDSQLQPDEYIVVYRTHGEGGHHFIKIQDGVVTEKNECYKIQNFSNWPMSLRHSPQAVFAVKKEHDMEVKDDEGEQKFSIVLSAYDGKDFEGTIEQAILNCQRQFSYHGHQYSLEKNNDEEGRAYVLCNGRIVGEVMIDGGECIVDVKPEEQDYVSNTKPQNTKYLELLKEQEQDELQI